MNNFSEIKVKIVCIIIFILFLLMAYYNNSYIYLLFAIFPALIYFSTKGVNFYDDSVFLSTRIIFWIIFSVGLIYKFNQSKDLLSTKALYTIWAIAICMGIWIGDSFAKFIYVRLKLALSKIFVVSVRDKFKIVKKEQESKKYLKQPGKKINIIFSYITIDIAGKEKKFLINTDLYEKIEKKEYITFTLNKGLFNLYFGSEIEL